MKTMLASLRKNTTTIIYEHVDKPRAAEVLLTYCTDIALPRLLVETKAGKSMPRPIRLKPRFSKISKPVIGSRLGILSAPLAIRV
jgi:hypothetical protein